MSKYTLGLDFGTESGRAVLVDVSNGREVASAVGIYRHGVITEQLPDSNVRLASNWALQDPADYIEVLGTIVKSVLEKSRVDPREVIGLGVDFTSCTILPTTADGTPLCSLTEWRDQPHAWVKLWKHHAAQSQANKLNQIARVQGYNLLDRYGGKVSSEWFFPKAWQILEEAPAVYAAADRIIEAGDWLVWQLTGQEQRSASLAGFKALWSHEDGFPSAAFFKSLDPRLENIVTEKMQMQVLPPGSRAGGLSDWAADLTGLVPGTPVAVASVDAHAAVPAAMVAAPGTMVIAMGTSNCQMVLDSAEKFVPGICGSVKDGIVPGLVGYEAGQPSVGDGFAWFVKLLDPTIIGATAGPEVDLHSWLEERAAQLKPGASGLLALDWWNGNRSVLDESDLSGLILGLRLNTRPEEIYRALIEATAYGTRLIIETFEQAGIDVRQVVVSGGLPDRNRMLMQIYADVTGRELRIAASQQASAFGAAIYGAVAAGVVSGGYNSVAEACQNMARLREAVYRPNPDNQAVYSQLYAEYLTLHDYFGRGLNDVMHRLKDLQTARHNLKTDSTL